MATAITKRVSKTSTPAAKPDPLAARLERQMLHGPGVGGHVYAQQVKVVASDEALQDTAFGHPADVLRRLNCRDPLEEMLALQALWAHARLARLSATANNQNVARQRADDQRVLRPRKRHVPQADARDGRVPSSASPCRRSRHAIYFAQQQVVQAVTEKPTNEQG